MKKTLGIILLFSLIFLSACSSKNNIKSPQTESLSSDSQIGETCSLNTTGSSNCEIETGKLFAITSISFTGGEKIPSRYSCMGKNINPSFQIENTPKGTQSFAMILHDPDGKDGDWIHWMIRNFPGNITKIEEGKTPLGAVIGKNSWGKTEYRGPCPPSGTHKYLFKLYAVDTNYGDLPSQMTLKSFEEITKGHILGTAEIYGTYSAK